VKRFLSRIFRHQSLAEILREQLTEAERLQALHHAAAEHHAALAGMYRGRAERITRQQVQGGELRAVK
jgi:hypothetical protein